MSRRPIDHSRRGYTLYELVIVVLIVAMIGLIVVPGSSHATSSTALQAAARALAADIEFCQSECITRPDPATGASTRTEIIFDTVNNKYFLARANAPTTPISHPADSLPYVNDFATGRNSYFSGVALNSVSVSNSGALSFDPFGRPIDPAAPNTAITVAPAIRLMSGGQAMTVSVDPSTGDVSIQ